MDIGFAEIDKWHKARGWKGCGYHTIIRVDGSVEYGRAVDPFEQGAHCKGRNHYIGVCWVGGKTKHDKIRPSQMVALRKECSKYMKAYGFNVNNVHGHNEFSSKDCPQIDMGWFRHRLN